MHAKGISRKERLRLARMLVADPASLAELFRQSVLILVDYLPNAEGFYTSRRHYAVGETKASSTADLALRIRDCGGLAPQAAAGARAAAATVPGVAAVSPEQLAGEYLDREIVATRTTGHAGHGGTAVRLDHADRTDGADRVWLHLSRAAGRAASRADCHAAGEHILSPIRQDIEDGPPETGCKPVT